MEPEKIKSGTLWTKISLQEDFFKIKRNQSLACHRPRVFLILILISDSYKDCFIYKKRLTNLIYHCLFKVFLRQCCKFLSIPWIILTQDWEMCWEKNKITFRDQKSDATATVKTFVQIIKFSCPWLTQCLFVEQLLLKYLSKYPNLVLFMTRYSTVWFPLSMM